MPPIQATLEQQIDQLARDNDLAWVQIKAMQSRLDLLTAEVEALAVGLGREVKRGPGRPRKTEPPLAGAGHEPTP